MIDLHLHTTASDGSLTPPALAVEAARAGLRTISVTDHDTTAGLADAAAACEQLGLRLIPGVEVTAVEEGRDVHVLGYFIDPDNPELREFLMRQRADRVRRVRDIGERLRALGCPVALDGLVQSAGGGRTRAVGRPQVADALVAAGHAASRRDAFDRLLAEGRPAFVARCGAPVRDVVRVIVRAGGIASLAHPGLTNVDARIGEFARDGLHALEVRHTDHDAEAEARYRRLAGDLGLAVSGGSDFHGNDTGRAPAPGAVTIGPEDLAALEARRSGTR